MVGKILFRTIAIGVKTITIRERDWTNLNIAKTAGAL